MTATEIKTIRQGIKFDMRSFSACLGIPLSTYQRYENGTAKIPANIERHALEIQQINVTFIQGLPDRVDELVSREFPNGILSEVAHGMD